MSRRQSPSDREALGAFLASRRARLRPGDFGLASERRRTPGLRREEVAVLAGVSVSWYTWLEQGRDIQASADTLRRIGEVLKLDRVEAAHLLALSLRETWPVAAEDMPSDGVLTLLQALDPIPAYVRNARFDILAWNAAVAELFVDYDALRAEERNTLRLMFLHLPYRDLIGNWEALARRYVAAFRAARTRARDRSLFDALAEEIAASSAEFREWWAGVDVDVFDEGIKRLRHPTFGAVDFTYVTLAAEGQPDLTMVTYVPRRPDYDRKS